MKKISALLIWLILFFTVINLNSTNYNIVKNAPKKAPDPINYTNIGTVTTIAKTPTSKEKASITTTPIKVGADLAQYKNADGGNIDCDESFTLTFVSKPGNDLEVIDASVPGRVKTTQTNTIIAGQGFDATVVVEANLSGGGCNTPLNRETLRTKLTRANSSFNLTFSPSERLDEPYANRRSIKYQTKIEDSVLLADRVRVTYRLPNPYLNPDTGETFYVGYDLDWQRLTKNAGYYYTELNACPKVDPNTGAALVQYYIVEFQYDRTEGNNPSGTNEDTSYPRVGGSAFGQYYIAQELLTAASAGACKTDDENRMTNNFYYTSINYDNPFNNDKFKEAGQPVDLLNWAIWDFNKTTENNWSAIESRTGNTSITNKTFDFNSTEGIRKLREIKELYKEEIPADFTNGYTADFKTLLNIN